jgi:uncharacterized repeat protein (TIGR01451 family)
MNRSGITAASHGRALVLLLALGVCASGCAQNPSYFPYIVPFGSIVQTHAKPPGPGYYADFDKYAVRLEVRPMKDANGQEITNQARTQHVLIATVYDENGNPRRERRVEWMIEGAGHILEVDESGWLPGRGYKTSDKHAVSYTNRGEHRITRGDNGPAPTLVNKENDFMIRPGQTWCVLSSAIEGDTHVTVYAPGIANWEKNKVYTTIRWVDAVWEFPQPAQKPAGSEHIFTTKLARATTKQPLAGYRVRYRIKDGAAAYFLPDKGQEFTAVSDLSGNANATIVQLNPVPSLNNVDIEVIRPPDPTAPSGTGVVIARGVTSIEWLAPNVQLSYTGPATALVGEDVTYTATLQNIGKAPSDGITLTAPLPRGMEFVRSVPPSMGNVNGEMLFTIGSLPPNGQPANVQLTFRAKELGQTSSVISMKTGNQTDRKEVVTNIADAKISVAVDGPQRASVGQTVPINVRVTNSGGGVLNNIQLKAVLQGNIVDAVNKTTTLTQVLKNPLAPGQTVSDVINVIPSAKGRAEVQVFAAAGTVSSSASHGFDVTEPTVSLSVNGPQKKYVGTNATFTIRVTNPGDSALNNVTLRNLLPPEFEFVTAESGQLTGREVVWSLGNLGPGQSRDLKLVARANAKTPRAQQQFTVTSENAAPANQTIDTEIFAAAGLKLEMHDVQDPVPANDKAVYKITVTNTGTDEAKEVRLAGQVVPQLDRVLEGSGPTQITINGKIFSFQPFALKPGQKAEFTVICATGNLEGDGVFRCQLEAPGIIQGTIVEDENTRVYLPRPGAAIPPPNNAPGGPFGGANTPLPSTALPANIGIPPIPSPPSPPIAP